MWRSLSEVKGAQSCPTLCDPVDYTVHGILQARILEWVAFPFSRGSSQPRDQTQVFSIAEGGFYQLRHKGNKQKRDQANQGTKKKKIQKKTLTDNPLVFYKLLYIIFYLNQNLGL